MRLIGLLIAIALATAAAYVVWKFTSDDRDVVVAADIPNKPVEQVEVVVARRDIPIGTVLKQEDLDSQPWPAHLKLEEFIVTSPEKGAPNLAGMVTRTPFKAKEPLVMNRLANPNDPSFLAASLPKSKRAVTIAVNAISGVAGFVFPGDRVDVLVTHDVPKQNVSAAEKAAAEEKGEKLVEKVTEVLIADVRVLATNQRSTAENEDQAQAPTSVSIEVTQAEAQKIRLASDDDRNGLSLALRSLHDKEDKSMVRPTGSGDLSRITPPNYYPILYDHTKDYQSKTVDIFGKSAAGDVVEEGNDSLAAEGLEGLNYESNPSKDIVVIRGVKKETVGVDRP